jgi:hypothetical protein
MAHTQAIDEAAPAGTDSASGGAAQFRDLKRDIRQREELEHYWNDALTGDQEDGKHINITQKGSGIIANKSLVDSEGYSLTGSNAQSAITQTGTWNTTGTPTFWKGILTDTASNAASKFISWVVGGAEKFTIDKAGDVTKLKGVTYAFPGSQGAASTVLTNNGSGTLSWATVSATPAVLSKTADYTVATGDGDNVMILTTSSGGNVTITLYAASGNAGKVVHVKKLVAANSVIIDGNSSETIDGATTQTITAQYTSLSLVCDGSNWHIY